MFLRSTLAVALLALGSVLGSCREQHAWDAIDWQPLLPPQRIVLASVLAAESLLEVLPHERIAGVHSFAANARYSLVADRLAGLRLLGATPEQLISVRPDLVLVDAYTGAETLALLAAAGVPIVRTVDPHSFEDVEANMRLLGRVTHREQQVAQVVGRMYQKLSAVRAAGKDLREWRLLNLDGLLHTHGAGSLFDEIVRAAGARNLAGEHGVGLFRKLDIEEVIAWRPDAIVLSGEPPVGGGLPKWIQEYPGFAVLTCVQRRRLLFVPTSLLSTTSHHLVDAAEFVQRQLQAWGKP